MTSQKVLSSQEDAEAILGNLFESSSPCTLDVCEEDAFGEPKYFNLGHIRLFPEEDSELARRKAVKSGGFEWSTPSIDDAKTSLSRSIGLAELKGDARPKAEDKLRRFLDSLGSIPVRLGLAHPVFDPRALEAMPYKRPATVVSDTSGVVQGGLSFVARYLFPAVRIKVPAVVQMEVVNFADRFFTNRRSVKKKPVELVVDHVMSQAAQRVLLQLELHSDVELERTFLLGDPLRGAFQREEDKELKELNMNTSIRAYADRLILEAARQHQTQVSFGHPVMLLTSDQGLARMAIGEGVEPIYFKSSKANVLFGRRLTGANFHPFSGALSTTSLTSLVWELATIFGCCRLQKAEGPAAILVHAIGKDLAWAPYHSRDDLLWIECQDGVASSPPVEIEPPAKPAPAQLVAASLGSPEPQVDQRERRDKSAALYKFSLERLVRLIDLLDTEQTLSYVDVKDALGVKADSAVADYRRFLESGLAIQAAADRWISTPVLRQVAIALRTEDANAARSALERFTSYAELERALASSKTGEPFPIAGLGRASSTYQALAEVTGIGANVYGTGFFPTLTQPTDEEFTSMALQAFNIVQEESGWAATGKWLETLIIKYGVHPLFSRIRLQSSSERRLLKRVTEGSTTDIKYDKHTLRVLGTNGGYPNVQVVHLYRGDFLIPGKSSSSLRIEEVAT